MSLIIANILCAIAFVVHTIFGDREVRQLEPTIEKGAELRQYWTMVRCGWHWVSFDLLAASIFLALVNFSSFFQSEETVLQLLAIYFMGYGLFWLGTIFISKSFPKRFLYLGQWALLWLIGGLIWMGM